MRMDPRVVAAQLLRLCGAIASGALSLDGLGALPALREAWLFRSIASNVC